MLARNTGAAKTRTHFAKTPPRPVFCSPLGLAAVRPLCANNSVTNPLTPPVKLRKALPLKNNNGPNRIQAPSDAHVTAITKTHAPILAHHSRSSSELHRLASPTKTVPVTRKIAKTIGTANDAYGRSTS